MGTADLDLDTGGSRRDQFVTWKHLRIWAPDSRPSEDSGIVDMYLLRAGVVWRSRLLALFACVSSHHIDQAVRNSLPD